MLLSWIFMLLFFFLLDCMARGVGGIGRADKTRAVVPKASHLYLFVILPAK
jgi:hypothetical protein